MRPIMSLNGTRAIMGQTTDDDQNSLGPEIGARPQGHVAAASRHLWGAALRLGTQR